MNNPQPRGPMAHDLKCWPEPFQAVKDGLKPFEWRRDDRDYQVGDTLHLREWRPSIVANEQSAAWPAAYTGREITVTVTYILHGPGFDIPEGYCIMGIVPVQQQSPNALITMAWMERAVTGALAKLDTLGHPHATACELAGAWGALKGIRQLESTAGTAPPVTVHVNTLTGARRPDCGNVLPFGRQVRTCSCGTLTVLGNGVRLTCQSVAHRTFALELVSEPGESTSTSEGRPAE